MKKDDEWHDHYVTEEEMVKNILNDIAVVTMIFVALGVLAFVVYLMVSK